MRIRELQRDDVGACAAVFAESLNAVRAAHGLPTTASFPEGEPTIAHLLATDPGGSFVADGGDGPVGFAQAARRGGVWALGKLFVSPAAQGSGAGRALLDAAAAYGAGLPSGLICSTPDPRALRSYARLPGFELHPTFTASGAVRTPAPGRDGVREGDAGDLAFAARVDERIRGGAHGPDLEYLLARDSALLVVEDRGYAVAGPAGPRVVAALDEEAAASLLRACLRRCAPGAEVRVPRIGSAHQWALRAVLDAGLGIAVGGALATRGNDAARAAYLPDNVFC